MTPGGSESLIPETGNEVRGDDQPDTLKVSVVVPVHNPGAALERSIGSVLDQSLPSNQYEVIFVDDGSTDGSGDRLDAIAADHQNITVLHIPASGSPGRPRNLGIEHARGEYIQFLDADDRLSHGALERQLDMAIRNDSDIVIGKLGSNFRGVTWGLFRRNVEAGSLATTPVITNLTVCKMFRAAMLREHAILFPEGWPKIEDEHFVVRSYLAARTISVVADEPCYLYSRRDDDGNLSSVPLDPEQYYGHLGEILSLIEEAIPAGSYRANLQRRFYGAEMLGRLGDDAFLAMPDEERARLVEAMRRLALEHCGDEVHGGLPPLLRVRSLLLRQGRVDALVQLATRERTVRLYAMATGIEAAAEGIIVRYRIGVRWADGSPFLLVGDGRRLSLDPRLTDGLAVDDGDCSLDPQGLRVEAALHEQDGWLEWTVKPRGGVRLETVKTQRGPAAAFTPVATGRLAVDVGAPGPSAHALTAGAWAFMLRLRGLGLDLRALAVAAPGTSAPDVVALLPDPAGVARARFGDGDVLELVVQEGVAAIGELLRERQPAVLRKDEAPRLRLRAHVGPAGRQHVGLEVRAVDGSWSVALPGNVRHVPDRSGGTIIDSQPPSDALPAGESVLVLRVGSGASLPLAPVAVDPTGRIRVDALPRVGMAGEARMGLVVAGTILAAGARRAARRVARRKRAGG